MPLLSDLREKFLALLGSSLSPEFLRALQDPSKKLEKADARFYGDLQQLRQSLLALEATKQFGDQLQHLSTVDAAGTEVAAHVRQLFFLYVDTVAWNPKKGALLSKLLEEVLSVVLSQLRKSSLGAIDVSHQLEQLRSASVA